MTPVGGMPTSTVAPLRFISETPCSAAPLTPTVTNTQSALRPPVSSATPRGDVLAPGVDRMGRAEGARGGELARLDVDGDDRRAAGEPGALDGVEADAAAADDDDARPGLDAAVLTTAPTPVSTPQAMSDALSSGTSFGIATACDASTTMCSAKAPVRRPWTSGLPAPSSSGVAGRAETPPRRTPARPRRRPGRSRSCGSASPRHDRRA